MRSYIRHEYSPRAGIAEVWDQICPAVEATLVASQVRGRTACASTSPISPTSWLGATPQPTSGLTRQVSHLLGLGAGAGLDSADLKRLRRADVVDHGAERGIEVRVTNLKGSRSGNSRQTQRTVWVLKEYEDLVRRGIAGVAHSGLLLGVNAERANVAAAVYARASLGPEIPQIAQGRLRSTWMATHLTRCTPLNVLLEAAGLTTARTLIELLPHLPKLPAAEVLR